MFKRIYIEITNTCNLHCAFCKGSDRPKKFMSVDDFETVLKKVEGYTEYIYLHLLGEPLLHPELSEILELAYKYGMKVNLTTNARLLEKKLDIINSSKAIRQINISLHSFEKAEDISNLLDVIDKISLGCYISLRLWNLGVENNNDKVIEVINNHYKTNILNDGKNTKIKDNLYLDFESEFKWPDINDQKCGEVGTCYGLRTHIGILVDGTVVPCCLDTDGIMSLGNIFESNLKTILDTSKCKAIKQGFLDRKLVEPLCQRCHYISRFDKMKR